MSRPVLEPSTEHPITIEPTQGRVVVRVGDTVVANSDHALTLQESTYPAARYIPREDLDLGALESSELHTYCPYKGDAGYFSIRVGDQFAEDAIWTYEAPYDAVSQIKDYVAFYPNRVDAIVESPAVA
jgi:uncharacterized protein (DUF427 family)